MRVNGLSECSVSDVTLLSEPSELPSSRLLEEIDWPSFDYLAGSLDEAGRHRLTDQPLDSFPTSMRFEANCAAEMLLLPLDGTEHTAN